MKPLAKIRGRSGDSVRAGTLRRGDLEAFGGLLENIGDGAGAGQRRGGGPARDLDRPRQRLDGERRAHGAGRLRHRGPDPGGRPRARRRAGACTSTCGRKRRRRRSCSRWSSPGRPRSRRPTRWSASPRAPRPRRAGSRSTPPSSSTRSPNCAAATTSSSSTARRSATTAARSGQPPPMPTSCSPASAPPSPRAAPGGGCRRRCGRCRAAGPRSSSTADRSEVVAGDVGVEPRRVLVPRGTGGGSRRRLRAAASGRRPRQRHAATRKAIAGTR